MTGKSGFGSANMNAATRLVVGVLALLAVGVAQGAQEERVDRAERIEFPTADPESVGMSRAALEALDGAVRQYVEREETVGAELMVIKNRQIVWHTVHGLRDRNTGEPMRLGDIFCIRSQTKSIVGTAIQMLIDDGKLALDDRVAQYIPAFDHDAHAEITIRNLLEHRSGLPLSSLISTDHRTLNGIQDVANLAGQATLEFAPGTDFNYSDDGTDTLTAIIEKVTGESPAAFIQRRILDPLGMTDTIPVLSKDDPRLERINPLHVGSRGSWNRFWTPQDDLLFPYFLGSQSMYSTCEDYARLLCLWADGGVVGNQRLLSPEAIARGLTPASKMNYPNRFQGLASYYGQLWMLRVPESADGSSPDELAATRPVVFGHGGSDGTIAWMWPQEDLIVSYYTQSRGGLTVVTIEDAIDRFLIRGDLTTEAAPVANLQEYEGAFWENDKQRFWAIRAVDGKLCLEIQGLTAADLVPTDDKDTWAFELDPNNTVRFERSDSSPDAENPEIARIVVTRGRREPASLERLGIDADLPTADEVVEKVLAAHNIAAISGVIQRSGTLDMEVQKTQAPYTGYQSRDSMRADIEVAGTLTRVLVTKNQVWRQAGTAEPIEVTGADVQQARWDAPMYLYGDWRKLADDVQVLRRIERDGQLLIVVRVVAEDIPSMAMIVDEQTGRLVEHHSIANFPGLGMVGLVTSFLEFEEVGGALLPRRSSSTYATPLLGTMELRFDSQSVIEESPEAIFSLGGSDD
jgi:CubicO group peptidase (beta-lactamase class C family)